MRFSMSAISAPIVADISRSIEVSTRMPRSSMEERGIRVDTSMLREMSATMGAEIADMEKRIYAEAGNEFNINPPQQLAHILFEKLQYPVVKKTKGTKAYSTSMDVLQELAGHGYAGPQ